MREIALGKNARKHKGLVALVDDCDFEELNSYHWHASWLGSYYAVRNQHLPNGKKRSVSMHRHILQPDNGLTVDHVNHCTLDNRRINLRVATRREQSQNKRSTRKSLSKFKGVYWYKNREKWEARIRTPEKRIYLGLFSNEVDAAKAYDKAAIDAHGEFACLNFPASANNV